MRKNQTDFDRREPAHVQTGPRRELAAVFAGACKIRERGAEPTIAEAEAS